jgi:hypothetical protein
VARSLIARIFGEAAGGMPAPRWDAGDDEREAQAVLDSLAKLHDKVGAQALRRF